MLAGPSPERKHRKAANFSDDIAGVASDPASTCRETERFFVGGRKKKIKKKSEPFAKRPNPGFLNPISFRSGLQPED